MDKMDKSLSDWTLGEARELCAGRSYCKGCPMAGAVCSIEKVVCPQEWDLTDKPRFTEEEVVFLRYIESVFPGSNVKKIADSALVIEADMGKWALPAELLPSLRPGQPVCLEDVLGEV